MSSPKSSESTFQVEAQCRDTLAVVSAQAVRRRPSLLAIRRLVDPRGNVCGRRGLPVALEAHISRA